MINKLKRPELLFFIVTACWAFSFPLMRNASVFVSADYFLTMRLGLASIIILPFLIYKRNLITKQRIISGIILGFFLLALIGLTFIGVSLTKAGNIAFLTGLNVIFVPILFCLFGRGKIDIFNIFSIICVLCGIFLLAGDTDLKLDIGNIVGLLTGIVASLQIIMNKQLTKNENEPFVIGAIQIITAFIFSFCIFLFIGSDNYAAALNVEVIWALLITGIFSTAVAFTLQTIVQKYTDPIKTSIFFSSEPIFALVLSILILKPNGSREVFSYFELSGLMLIFLAIILSEDIIKNKIKSAFKKYK